MTKKLTIWHINKTAEMWCWSCFLKDFVGDYACTLGNEAMRWINWQRLSVILCLLYFSLKELMEIFCNTFTLILLFCYYAFFCKCISTLFQSGVFLLLFISAFSRQNPLLFLLFPLNHNQIGGETAKMLGTSVSQADVTPLFLSSFKWINMLNCEVLHFRFFHYKKKLDNLFTVLNWDNNPGGCQFWQL